MDEHEKETAVCVDLTNFDFTPYHCHDDWSLFHSKDPNEDDAKTSLRENKVHTVL